MRVAAAQHLSEVVKAMQDQWLHHLVPRHQAGAWK
jgi:hypothetical protein